MVSEFERDTAISSSGNHCWRGTITPRWNIGAAPNGGYVMAMALRALLAESPHPDPLTVTGHYLRRSDNGPVEITTDIIKAGRTTSTGQASVLQDGSERLRMLASFSRLDSAGPTVLAGGPPDLPAAGDCVSGDGLIPGGINAEVERRFDIRVPQGTYGWAEGTPKGTAEHTAYIRFADGFEPDLLAVCVMCDAFPPSVFDLGATGWIPTIELTVHLRARPAPGWLRARVSSRFLTNGFVEEDVELWDSEDNLVALSRQMAVAARTVEP